MGAYTLCMNASSRGELDWNDLRLALAVARTGSLRQAAEIIGVNQSTAGRRLSTLETSLNTLLFRRSRRGMTPTETGEILITRAAEIESHALTITDAIEEAGSVQSGVLRLIGNQWVIDRLVTHGLAAFVRASNGLSLRITTGRPKASLWRGEPGVALWFEQEPLDGAFAIELARVPYAVYRTEECHPDNWVVFHDEDRMDSRHGHLIEQIRQQNGRIIMTATDAGSLFSGIVSGLGQGFLPCCLAEADPRLILSSDTLRKFDRPLYLHSHPDTLNVPRVQAAMQWLREHAAPILIPARTPMNFQRRETADPCSEQDHGHRMAGS
ncbi:MAG: LysR family transcriptional regulator [Pseudomonadota bacterium]